MIKKATYTLKGIQNKLLPILQEKDSFIVGLVGDLGSGKTTFICDLLCLFDSYLKNEVSSPTFSIQQIYKSNEKVFNHFDLYRIEEYNELEDIGFFEIIEEQKCITFIEWVNIFPSLVSYCDVVIEIKVNNQEERVYTVI